MTVRKLTRLLNSYSGGPSSKNEVKTLDGVTRGSYSYIDANSKLQTVEYVSDALGFRVAATNLPTPPVDNNVAPVDTGVAPEPVQDTPEVQAARTAHLAAVEEAKRESSASEEAPELVAPEPVEDTVEVKRARAEHLQAVEVAKARNAEPAQVVVADHQPQVVVAAHPHLIASPLAYHSAVHVAHAPVALLRSPASFAYSVVSA